MCEILLKETEIVDSIKKFLYEKERGNWHEEKTKTANGHEHGADIVMRGGKRNSEYFIIECKGRSYARSARSVNREGWLNALGQLITRMRVKRIISSGNNKGKVNRAYKYGLGLCWESAQVALRRIPKEIAAVLNLYVFSCADDGTVKQFSPRDFGRAHDKAEFFLTEPKA